MLKRNGMRFVRKTKPRCSFYWYQELNDAAWFFIQRGPSEAFFGAIKGVMTFMCGMLLLVRDAL